LRGEQDLQIPSTALVAQNIHRPAKTRKWPTAAAASTMDDMESLEFNIKASPAATGQALPKEVDTSCNPIKPSKTASWRALT
jgi:hypothetical protein